MSKMYCLAIVALASIVAWAHGSDITSNVFGNATSSLPAAFGDFNNDKMTDIFVIREDEKTVDVLLSMEQDAEPLMRSSGLNCSFKDVVSSVVPGDFDGDTMMDVMVTTNDRLITQVYILWGSIEKLTCATQPLLTIKGQPLALDVNQDMITDLFGTSVDGNRTFWIFTEDRSPPQAVLLEKRQDQPALRQPHSHAFLDVNGDYISDLVLTTEKNFEIWLGQKDGNFSFNYSIAFPPGVSESKAIGQSLFVDVALQNKLNLIVPVCFDSQCMNSTIAVHDGSRWYYLQIPLKDGQGNVWGFVRRDNNKYTDVITLRAGDFNLDGYPDLLATLQTKGGSILKTLLLENVACHSCIYSRAYAPQWYALGLTNNTAMGAFFDFYQNGILDVILVQRSSDGKHRSLAFKNSLDYDANFIKVMVLTGLKPAAAVGKIPYGTNLPGPRVSYYTVTQDGTPRYGCAAQLQQSAHFPLQLPFSIFGLGRTPNFVDKLVTGIGGYTRDWLLVIPNSQMVVVPSPTEQPAHWRVQLFVTPSKTILETMAVLLGTCALNALIIGGLHLKERREDRLEKLQEAHRFHFDAM